jgi:RNase P subunit RPR2
MSNCWHCNAELIWGGDHNIDREDDTYSMVTNLTCPKCECIVYVYKPKDKENE